MVYSIPSVSERNRGLRTRTWINYRRRYQARGGGRPEKPIPKWVCRMFAILNFNGRPRTPYTVMK